MESAGADTDEPRRISETSSMRLVETLARYISIIAFLTEVSRPR